jgi:hypothetical protein
MKMHSELISPTRSGCLDPSGVYLMSGPSLCTHVIP